MDNLSSFLRTGKIKSKKDNRSDLSKFLSNGVQVSNPSKVLSLMKRNGVSTLSEFMALCPTEKEELIVELRAGGVNLGDRSKLNRTTAESISAWVACQASPSTSSVSLQTSPSDTHASASVDISSSPTQDDANSVQSEAGVPITVPIAPPNKLVGTLKGAPAWWNEHDKRIRQIARKVHLQDAVDISASPTLATYPWKRHDGCEWEAYQSVLWQRRAELLALGDFARNIDRRSEWLALVLELDATAGGDPARHVSGERPQIEAYSWYTRGNLTDDSGKRNAYVKVLLERRSQMLGLNLTKKKSLQTEWVLLMRELDAELQTNVNVTKAHRKQKQKELLASRSRATETSDHTSAVLELATSEPAEHKQGGFPNANEAVPTSGSVDDSGVDTDGLSSSKDVAPAAKGVMRVTEESGAPPATTEARGAPGDTGVISDNTDGAVGAVQPRNGDDGVASSSGGRLVVPGADSAARAKQRLTKANVAAWRTDVAQSIVRPDSLCSLLTDNSELQRVASLASFYSDAANTDEFFTGDEADTDDDDLGSCQSFPATAEEHAVAV